MEAMFAAWLASESLNFGLIVSIAFGLALAILPAIMASAVVTAWVRNGAEQQPAKQRDRIRRGLVRLGPLWLVACVCAVTILRSPEIAFGPLLFWISLGVIALVSPVASGLCQSGADLLSWSRRISKEAEAIRALARDLELFSKDSGRVRSAASLSRAAKVTVTSLALMAVTAATSRAADLPIPGDLSVRVYVDLSPSARPEQATQLLKKLATALAGYGGERGLAVSIIPFYEDAYMASPFIDIKISANRPRDCPVSSSELAGISRAYADAEARRCSQLRQQAQNLAANERSQTVAKLSAAIDGLATLKLPGRCSAVLAAIRRSARERPTGIAIIVSDMEESCASGEFPAKFQPENVTFLIPIGSRQHSLEARLDAIKTRFGQTMPWAQVVEPYNLDVVMDAITHPERSLPARR
jgi:hypothetical protein